MDPQLPGQTPGASPGDVPEHSGDGFPGGSRETCTIRDRCSDSWDDRADVVGILGGPNRRGQLTERSEIQLSPPHGPDQFRFGLIT